MKTIKIEDENVTTLKELAEKLADMYGWKSYEVANHAVNFKEDVIYFKALGEDGKEVHGVIDTAGFAKDVVSGKPLDGGTSTGARTSMPGQTAFGPRTRTATPLCSTTESIHKGRITLWITFGRLGRTSSSYPMG